MSKNRKYGGGVKQYPTPEILQQKIDEYFATAEQPFLVEELALYLDLTYEGLREYGNRPETAGIIKKAKMKIWSEMNKKGLQGKLNPTMVIFNGKCNYNQQEKIYLEADVNVKSLDAFYSKSKK